MFMLKPILILGLLFGCLSYSWANPSFRNLLSAYYVPSMKEAESGTSDILIAWSDFLSPVFQAPLERENLEVTGSVPSGTS